MNDPILACKTFLPMVMQALVGELRDDTGMIVAMRKEPKTQRLGRPPLHDGASKRAQFNTRLRQEVKKRLEQAAASAGRSLSEEIEHRLEQSLRDEEVAGGGRLHSLFRLLGGTAGLIEEHRGAAFLDDYETFVAVSKAWQKILNAVRPAATPEFSQWIADIGPEPPLAPEPPRYPTGKGLMGLPQPSEEALRLYERQQAEYEQNLAKWQVTIQDYRRRLNERVEHFKDLERFGEQVADALLRPPSQ
jgi:Arc-like DNA binding dprotein